MKALMNALGVNPLSSWVEVGIADVNQVQGALRVPR